MIINSPLPAAIKQLSQAPMTDAEADAAAANLASFVALLLEIDRQQSVTLPSQAGKGTPL